MSSAEGGLKRSPAASLLTVDVGNSTTKLRAWRWDAELGPASALRADVAGHAPDSAAVAEFFERAACLELAGLSSVASPEITALWCEHIARVTRARLFDELDSGLANRTLEPERVGRDRLFAARGALEWIGESSLVVDIGTALTVDALIVDTPARHGSAWSRGAFLGGAIAPGPALLARALASGAARLFEVLPVANPPALGRDTAGAMRAGVGIGLRGAVIELVREVGREAGLVEPPIALTGGARAFASSAFASRRVFMSEDLVHLGLCAALLESAGEARPRAFRPS